MPAHISINKYIECIYSYIYTGNMNHESCTHSRDSWKNPCCRYNTLHGFRFPARAFIFPAYACSRISEQY